MNHLQNDPRKNAPIPVPGRTQLPIFRTFCRVMRYALPYKLKLLCVLLAMGLFTATTFASYYLIKPLLDNHLGGGGDTVSSRQFVAMLEDGSEVLLSDLLSPEQSWFQEWLEPISPDSLALGEPGRRSPTGSHRNPRNHRTVTAVRLHVPGDRWFKSGDWRPSMKSIQNLPRRLSRFPRGCLRKRWQTCGFTPSWFRSFS